ncbi:MAG TPA: HAMP domain-containing sensor histidine kinase, partial [Exilispira sp.]|nr:HAMP domain-containing sensor histidine kinase [Exilispira sp.]
MAFKFNIFKRIIKIFQIKRVYLWVELFIVISLLLLLSSVVSYFFIQKIVRSQFELFVSKDIEKEKNKVIDSIKEVLSDIDSTILKEKTETEIHIQVPVETIDRMQNIFKEYNFLVSGTVYVNRFLIYSYRKTDIAIPPLMPQPFNNPYGFLRNNPGMKDFPKPPPKLRSGFLNETYVFRLNSSMVYTVNIMIYHEGARDFLNRIKSIFILFYVVMIVITLFLTYFIARNFSNPIRKLAEETIKLTSGKYGNTLNIKRKDEIGLLIDAFNELSEKLYSIQQFQRQLVTQVTHDITTPINLIRSYVYGINDKVIPINGETVSLIDGEIERILELIDDFNIFSSRENKTEKLPLLNLTSEIEIYAKKISSLFQNEDIDIELACCDEIIFPIRRNHFRSLLENIVKNSIIHNSKREKRVKIFINNEKDAGKLYNSIKDEFDKKEYQNYYLPMCEDGYEDKASDNKDIDSN